MWLFLLVKVVFREIPHRELDHVTQRNEGNQMSILQDQLVNVRSRLSVVLRDGKCVMR